MIIRAKLKPFSEWPCQRSGIYMCGANEKLSGLEIELDASRAIPCPWRQKGRAFGITYRSFQRMWAAGALANYASFTRAYADSVVICEHVIERPFRTLAVATARNTVRRFRLFRRLEDAFHVREKLPAIQCYQRRHLYDFDDVHVRCGKYFAIVWDEDWTRLQVGKVVECIGECGPPLYRVLLFPESIPIPFEENQFELFVTPREMSASRWKFYDSFKEMMDECERHQHSRDGLRLN